MRLLIAATIIFAIGLAHPRAAAADHGRASVRLTLRYGPSVYYRPILDIPEGYRLYVRRCTPRLRWCEVRYHRHVGWVRARYLIHPEYGRPYSYLEARLSLPIFDFFAHITNFDRDRRYRYRRYRYDDDYYRGLVRRHRRHRHHRPVRHHQRSHHRQYYRDGDQQDSRHRRHRDQRDGDRNHHRTRRHRDHEGDDDQSRDRRGRHRNRGDHDN